MWLWSVDILFQVFDYDDESGVYLGPGHAFDDEDLEYLNKDEAEDDNKQEKIKTTSPTSPLLVDSASGIYLGFDESSSDEDAKSDEIDTKTEHVNQNATDEEKMRDNEEAAKEKPKTVENCGKRSSLPRPLSMRTLLLSKQSSKYKVTQDEEKDGNICFRFLRKFWRRADTCN